MIFLKLLNIFENTDKHCCPFVSGVSSENREHGQEMYFAVEFGGLVGSLMIYIHNVDKENGIWALCVL